MDITQIILFSAGSFVVGAGIAMALARLMMKKRGDSILKAAQEFAPTEEIKNSIKHVAENAKTHKGITLAKFIGATVLTALSYFGLTKFRHNYTEGQIKKDFIAKKNIEKANNFLTFSSSFNDVHNQNKGKNVSFTGLQSFMFDPVKNLMIIDGVITGERLTHSRNKQDFMGYVIKEGSFWIFMYFAGQKIASAIEKYTESKHNKSIDLDARVIESAELKQAFADGSVKSHLEAFKAADTSNVDIYKYAVKQDTKNLVVDMAKKSDVVPLMQLSWFKKSDKVDTRKYIDLDELRGVHSKMEKLLSQFENSGETVDDFFKSLRKLKRGAVWANIGSCIAALGVLAPAIMLAMRKFGTNSEYQVKKDVEARLAQQ